MSRILSVVYGWMTSTLAFCDRIVERYVLLVPTCPCCGSAPEPGQVYCEHCYRGFGSGE